MDWQNYLLPAGESEYLGNMVKSMIVEPFSASESLSDRLNRRAVPFGGQKILVISSAKRKADKDKSVIPYLFSDANGRQISISCYVLWGHRYLHAPQVKKQINFFLEENSRRSSLITTISNWEGKGAVSRFDFLRVSFRA